MTVLTDIKSVLRSNGYKVYDSAPSIMKDNTGCIVEVDDIPEFGFESFSSYKVKYNISIFIFATTDEKMIEIFEDIVGKLSSGISNPSFKFDKPDVVDYNDSKTLKINTYYEKVITW